MTPALEALLRGVETEGGNFHSSAHKLVAIVRVLEEGLIEISEKKASVKTGWPGDGVVNFVNPPRDKKMVAEQALAAAEELAGGK